MSSYWYKEKPEILAERTIELLPEPWKTKVEKEEIDLYDIPEDILMKTMEEASTDLTAGMADHVYDMHKGLL